MLKSILVWFIWVGAVLFLPIETYLSFQQTPIPVSGYIVNVLGVFIAIWGTVSLRRGKPYGEGVLATGLGWTTAAAWRATNLRYWLADQGQPLGFGSIELWVAPVLTAIAGVALAGSLVLLLKAHKPGSS
jgi:hypothetical protein